jgi:hypothetical protein
MKYPEKVDCHVPDNILVTNLKKKIAHFFFSKSGKNIQNAPIFLKLFLFPSKRMSHKCCCCEFMFGICAFVLRDVGTQCEKNLNKNAFVLHHVIVFCFVFFFIISNALKKIDVFKTVEK